jgi:hypothetical protein
VPNTVYTLLNDAAAEVKVARAGDTLQPAIADLLLLRLNTLLDAWNADERAAYDQVPYDFVLTPGHSPHTIGAAGSGADYVVPMRPVKLIAAQLNIGGSPAAYLPITVQGDDWYRRQTVPGLSMSVPTDVYFSPAWPVGQLYFWGVPSVAYTVRLWMAVILANITDPTIALSLPPGYYKALMLSLAEFSARALGQTLEPELVAAASIARAAVFGNNDPDMRLETADAGLPCGGGYGFNWLNRTSG